MEISSEFIFSLLLLLGPILISRFIMEGELKSLESDMKLKLLEAFSNQRKFSLIISLPSLILYLLALKYYPEYTWKIIFGFGFFYIIYFACRSFLNYRKVISLGAPLDYIKKYRIAIILIFLGFLGFGIQTAYNYNSGNDEDDNAYKGSVLAYKAYQESLKHDYLGSVRDYSAAIELDSSVSDYFLNRGTSYFYLGEKLKAERDYKKASALGDTLADHYLLFVR